MLQHIAFIMDGNRRWAKEKKLPAFIGHKRGIDKIEQIVSHAQKFGIPYVTFWAFSTENWNRNKDEVTYLMELFRKALKGTLFKRLIENGGKICILGDMSAFPKDIQEGIARVIDSSKKNTEIHINIALNYGGREEIVHAVQRIVSNRIVSEKITQDVFSEYLYTKNQPDPDLIIRTGGEQRLSGYLPWQSIYSELYFIDTYWPDFDRKAFEEAIEEYGKRERRFGR